MPPEAGQPQAGQNGKGQNQAQPAVDPEKAKPLNDKQTAPFLIDEKSETMLQVPEMEQVGQLRQTVKAEAGREYWMVFSNRGRFVKAGDRVDVNIGPFRAHGLIVE